MTEYRDKRIPFSRPSIAGPELNYVAEVLSSAKWGGDGSFSVRCQHLIENSVNARHALLTHSCTAALELATIIARLEPGDEVIMPSFTFASTANSVVLRGAVPVFVDIRPDTLNLDEGQIESAITPRTRAIMAVHYAGVCCAMDEISTIARNHGLLVIEDAAHAYLSKYRNRHAGGLGDMAAISFHETKNVVSGEGGAFVTNRSDLQEAAEIVREKGTNRSQFMRGEIDKYSWIDVGSSFLPSEIVAAVLLAQLEGGRAITARRVALWNGYHDRFAEFEARGRARRPIIPRECEHNGHLYYLLLEDVAARSALVSALARRSIAAAFHYVPLHNSTAGRRFGRSAGDLPVTVDIADRLVRLPLFATMTDDELDQVAEAVIAALN